MRLCKCGRLIPQGVEMCQLCKKKHGSRHMIYNREIRDKKSAAFYSSRAWRTLRDAMIQLFDGVDIVAFYEQGELLEADRVHHIEELKEAWDLRLEPMNLIPLNNATHTRITLEYKTSRAAMEACQKRLIEYRNRWFAERGGIEKVLHEAFGVPAPDCGEKTPHGDF